MLLRLLNWIPQGERAEPVIMRAPAPVWDVAQPLTVLTWNLQYCGTRRHHYFYDGGPESRPSPENARDGLAAILATLDRLRAEGVDLALLQELDRDSDRTARVDQLAALVPGWANWVSTPYHRSLFVPSPAPPKQPLGRVDFHQAVLSGLRLTSATRTPLPLLNESPLRQAFNLHRAILTTYVPMSDGRTLTVGVTHLSAFSRGDGTMQRQVNAIRDWIHQRGDQPFVFGGDFNLLPPGDDPARLGKDAGDYAEDVLGQLDPLCQRLPALGQHTYLPPGAERPDRTLDHLLLSKNLSVRSCRVVPLDPWISDHWPLIVQFSA